MVLTMVAYYKTQKDRYENKPKYGIMVNDSAGILTLDCNILPISACYSYDNLAYRFNVDLTHLFQYLIDSSKK